MRNIFLFFGLLLAYTLIYTGISKVWGDVTVYENVTHGAVP
jgi:hypothetical protein